MYITPLHNYKHEVFDTKAKPITVRSTGVTIIVENKKGQKLYGIHNGLPQLTDTERTLLNMLNIDKFALAQNDDTFMSGDKVANKAALINVDKIEKIYENTYVLYYDMGIQSPIDYDKQSVYSVVSNGVASNSCSSVYRPITTSESLCNTQARLQQISDRLEKVCSQFGVEDDNKKITGENKMANIFNIKVGKAGSNYSITYFGTVAFKGKTYYQSKIYDAEGMTMPFDMLYLVPANTVAKGDIIEKDNEAYYVLGSENGVINAINLDSGKSENLVPGGMYGMTMYSKLFNPMGSMKGENAFGNIMMMQALTGNKNSADNGMLMAMMMMQGGFKFPTFDLGGGNVEDKKEDKGDEQ